ncbi:MAG: hypothetical protein ACAH05_06605 [Methylophilus sp.]|nr:hypothetical protein [Methylophilus sp.]
MLEKSRLDHTWIEPTNLDCREGETSSRHTNVREERLQSREGKSCSRTVKQALAINHLKVRKVGD